MFTEDFTSLTRIFSTEPEIELEEKETLAARVDMYSFSSFWCC